MAFLIETKNLSKVYEDGGLKTRALEGINLQIKEGEFVAIVGPSGSGKSTLMQILGCLDQPTSGQYFFEGKDIDICSDGELAFIRNRKFGFVFQSFNLLPRLSVLENVKLPLIYAETPETERTEIAEGLINLIGLAERAFYPAVNLSGGEKQRVAIARALVNSPKIIFADEPTGNLDSKSGAVILEFFQKLHQEGHTVVIVTHETYVAQSAHRVLHIKDGQIEKDERNLNHRVITKESFIK